MLTQDLHFRGGSEMEKLSLGESVELLLTVGIRAL